ncbi:MAG: hypothetical protein J0H05_00210, partial [Stenotrophomonas acidaminiphila]|nr:hypothetical protein [Stenotrophomonas acidaminiphila]
MLPLLLALLPAAPSLAMPAARPAVPVAQTGTATPGPDPRAHWPALARPGSANCARAMRPG